MATTAAAGHSGTKDFHQVQFTPRVLVALNSSPTDANPVASVAGVAADNIGVEGGIGIVCSGEGGTLVGQSNSSTSTSNINANSNKQNTNTNNTTNRIGQSMKNQLPVIKPDTLLNGTGIFTIYCFVKEFIGASGTSAVAIDNKIEQAMDLVKSHLMIAVREEVEVLKEKISELMDKINQLEVENTILKANMPQETLHQLQITGGVNNGRSNMIAAPPQQQQQQQQQPQQQQIMPPISQQVIMQQQQQQQQAPIPINPAANSTTGPMS